MYHWMRCCTRHRPSHGKPPKPSKPQRALRRLCGNGRFIVEANDLGAVRLLMDEGVPFVTGPTLNIYNPGTLSVLAAAGLKRWALPVELA